MDRPTVLITGTGSYLPNKCLTNHDLSLMVDTTDEWIQARTGILERRIAAPGELTSDLAVQAARQAMAAAEIGPTDLDLILVATTTPDLVFPSTATFVQQKLGANVIQIPAFDIQAVCSGFIYALTVAEKFITAGSCRRVLVIGAETFSRIVNWEDRNTCILFGDGAGAVILEAGPPSPDSASKRGILATHIHADGGYAHLLNATGGVSKGAEEGLDPRIKGVGFVQMRGNEVFKQAVKVLGSIVDQTLAASGYNQADIDWLVPHQANIRIIESTAKRLGMDMNKVIVTVDRHGNTSAASIPLALDQAVRDGRIQRGHLVMLEAFGGGFTWGSALLRW
ncbi:MAG: ketoacyl-ACP synthase III [Magnetococcus sp. DMHC-6]